MFPVLRGREPHIYKTERGSHIYQLLFIAANSGVFAGNKAKQGSAYNRIIETDDVELRDISAHSAPALEQFAQQQQELVMPCLARSQYHRGVISFAWRTARAEDPKV